MSASRRSEAFSLSLDVLRNVITYRTPRLGSVSMIHAIDIIDEVLIWRPR